MNDPHQTAPLPSITDTTARDMDIVRALEQSIHTALRTYCNVHRGSGHNSLVSTRLYEHARDIVLRHLGLDGRHHVVLFCSRRGADALEAVIAPGQVIHLSSADIGLALGVHALVVLRTALPTGVPSQAGGGTTKLMAPDWVIWADAPDRFEAGTPAIINVIAFARALQLLRRHEVTALPHASDGHASPPDLHHFGVLEPDAGDALRQRLRDSLIGGDLRVPTSSGEARAINLDNSASTRTFAPVWDAFRETLRLPDEARHAVVRNASAICADMLGAPAGQYDVLFTMNTTEAVTLMAGSIGRTVQPDAEPVILTTLLEHSSNDLPWRLLPGHSIIRLGVDSDGFVDLAAMETVLREHNVEHRFGRKRIVLVTMSGASNVLGSCNDVAAAAALAHRHGALIMVDGAQLVAHGRVDMRRDGIDALAFSAHKVYAPFGSGALVVRSGLLKYGAAEMDAIHASGTENAAGIAALGRALALLQRIGMEVIRDSERALTTRMLRGLSQISGVRVFGIADPDSPLYARKVGVIAFDVKGRMPRSIARELAAHGGIGVRYGCHCAHILVKHMLGIPPMVQRLQWVIQHIAPRFRFMGVVRASLGIENNERDVDVFLQTLEAILRMRGRGDGPGAVRFEVAQERIDAFVEAAVLRVYS